MASQQQNIKGSSIEENSNVQQNQAGRDSVSFLNSRDNKIIIENNFLKLFPQIEASQVDWDWGMKRLKTELSDIQERLKDSLNCDRILMDISVEEQLIWVNRPNLEANRSLQIDGKDYGTLNANKLLLETFGRDDINGKLLILGAPGSGKTTALLSLAEQLVYGAISQPKTVIPVIFELSTWKNDDQSIRSWLIEQLYSLHGGNRKFKIYETWLDRQVLLPLMDGLDELGLERQKKCTEKLDEFAAQYPQLVICCRGKEFETIGINLRNLRGAVSIQSLSDSQIQNYFHSLNRSDIWSAIQDTPFLYSLLQPSVEGCPGLLRVPLFVNLLTHTYNPQQPINSKADLLEEYINWQLSFDKRSQDRRKGLKEYKWAYGTEKLEPDPQKTRSHLTWLAQNLQAKNTVELLIEQIQPSWINSDPYYQLPYIFIFPLSGGLIFGLIFGILANLNVFAMLNMSFIYFMLDLLIESHYETSLIAKYEKKPVNDLQSFYDGSIFGSLLIKPVEVIQLSISKAVRQEISKSFRFNRGELYLWLIAGLIFGISSKTMGKMSIEFAATLAIGLPTFGLIYLSIVALINGLKKELKELDIRSHPNQGIWNSLQSQIWTTSIIFVLTTLPCFAFSFLGAWLFTLFISLRIGFSTGGGRACSQHLALRIILWRNGLPWNFARFLNYCVERRLLLRVGGRYRFLHRELLDHFSQINY